MNLLEQEIDLDQELRLELEKLDQIFLADYDEQNQSHLSDKLFSPGSSRGGGGGGGNGNSRLSISAYELAEAEIEKEELQDRLQLLLSRTEDYDREINDLKRINFELKSRNDQYQRENERLLQRIQELEENASKRGSKGKQENDPALSPSAANSRNNEEEFRQLEFRLAETRSKLARTQQAYDDLSLAKDSALIELEKERMIRIHVEKERDAYSAAYEQSLLHFEKWTSKAKPAKTSLLSR